MSQKKKIYGKLPTALNIKAQDKYGDQYLCGFCVNSETHLLYSVSKRTTVKM